MKLEFGKPETKTALAAEARERRKVDLAKRALRERLEAGQPVSLACPTMGCGLMAWLHDTDWPCSPAMLWVPVLRHEFGHRNLVVAMKEIEEQDGK